MTRKPIEAVGYVFSWVIMALIIVTLVIVALGLCITIAWLVLELLIWVMS